MTTLDLIAGKIIKEQELIIGPLAWEEAGHVKGLRMVDKLVGEVIIEGNGDGRIIIDNLVKEYEVLFGRAAREVCRDAVKNLISGLSKNEIPSSLQ